MATSIESSSLASSSLDKGSETLMGSPPIFSPSSDNRFWNTLHSRIDSLLANRDPIRSSFDTALTNGGGMEKGTRLKEDTMLLLRGFDSVAHSLSQLSNNLENALQGARDLANPPTLTEILQSTLERAKTDDQKPNTENEEAETKEENQGGNRGQKRKLDGEQDQEEYSLEQIVKSSKELGKLNKAKNLAISMATKAGALARELKSIKSDLCFMQERCTLLEKENKRLRDDGITQGNITPEEDDLVRLQLEALLEEKSRLANENANLMRENRCLHQLVEYHRLTTQDLSASYENLIREMCLDFSSPITVPEEEGEGILNGCAEEAETPRPNILGFPKSLDQCYDEL